MTSDDAVAKLAQILSKGSSRKSFATDPDGTLRDNGVNPEDLPPEIYNVLSDLSDTELRAIARLKKAFDDAPDVDADQKLQMV